MGNERITENLVRDRLRDLGCFDPTNTIKVDEQKSAIESVTRLMKQASKAGGGGRALQSLSSATPRILTSSSA
jgi:hypothetical protein